MSKIFNSCSILTDTVVAVFAVFFIKQSSIVIVQLTKELKEKQPYLPRVSPRQTDENALFQILLDGDVDTNCPDETTVCSLAVACETCQKKTIFSLNNISFTAPAKNNVHMTTKMKANKYRFNEAALNTLHV